MPLSKLHFYDLDSNFVFSTGYFHHGCLSFHPQLFLTW
eukprot:10550.XXX_308759_308872_1 [CDS] Oithona nana genome sequencing.